MLRTIGVQDKSWFIKLQKEVRQLLESVVHMKTTHRAFFLKCAVMFMAVKIGIMLLTTISTMVFFLSTATSYLTVEMSKTQAILFAFPLTMIIMFKVYFISKMLMTQDASKRVIKSAVRLILLKGKQGMRRIEETIPADVSPLSLKRVRNC